MQGDNAREDAASEAAAAPAPRRLEVGLQAPADCSRLRLSQSSQTQIKLAICSVFILECRFPR